MRIVVSNAAIAARPPLPATLSGGRLQLDTVDHDNLVPIPLQASGRVRLQLELITAQVVEASGSDVRIETTASARYVEDLPADLRPPTTE